MISSSFATSSVVFRVELTPAKTHPLTVLFLWTVYGRFIDVGAWLETDSDLGIRVIAPFPVATRTGESLPYVADIVDFGASGIVMGWSYPRF